MQRICSGDVESLAVEGARAVDMASESPGIRGAMMQMNMRICEGREGREVLGG